MKRFLLLITIVAAAFTNANAQYDKCAESASLLTFYYTAEPHTSFGLGFEAGTQQVDSRIGYFAGFQFQRMSDYYFKKDSASFKLRASLYLKGACRITDSPSGKGSFFLVGSGALSVQTGFDFRPGLRFAYPLNEERAIGLEPTYSVRYKTASLNVLIIF